MGILKALLLAKIMMSAWKHACMAVTVAAKCAPYVAGLCVAGGAIAAVSPHIKPFMAKTFSGPRFARLPASPAATW